MAWLFIASFFFKDFMRILTQDAALRLNYQRNLNTAAVEAAAKEKS